MRRLLTVLVAAAVTFPAAAYVLPTDALLDQMREALKGSAASGHQVTGTLIRLEVDGTRTEVPAEHWLQRDGSCRLTALEDRRELAALEQGKARGETPDLALFEGLGCALWVGGRSSVDRVARLLRTQGVDVGYTGLGRLEGQTAYVIGARPWDEGRPQLWLDKDTLRPIRLVGRVDGRQGDVRLIGQAADPEGGWQPWRMELWQDGEPVLVFEAEQAAPKSGRR